MIQLRFRKEKSTFMIKLSDSNLKFGFRFTSGEKMTSKALSTGLFPVFTSGVGGQEKSSLLSTFLHPGLLGNVIEWI